MSDESTDPVVLVSDEPVGTWSTPRLVTVVAVWIAGLMEGGALELARALAARPG